MNASPALIRLALGSRCPKCKAESDEQCVTLARRNNTRVHEARIDRATSQYARAAVAAARERHTADGKSGSGS